jgi:adenine-specific DNA methylase
MDFCYVWLRLALKNEFDAFKAPSTKTLQELTGNEVMGRGLEHFTKGLSEIFCHYAEALKPGAPFVFTYHHNDPNAYIPIVVAILDAGLDCTATLPAPAEMGASLHIARTKSSVLDSVFVCRKVKVGVESETVQDRLKSDLSALQKAGLWVTEGDTRCLLAGHIARKAINRLRDEWELGATPQERMGRVGILITRLREELDTERLVKTTTESLLGKGEMIGSKTAF